MKQQNIKKKIYLELLLHIAQLTMIIFVYYKLKNKIKESRQIYYTMQGHSKNIPVVVEEEKPKENIYKITYNFSND